MDRVLLGIVLEDLDYLTKEWNARDISDANLRRSSHILRRLLIYGDLYKAARLVEVKKLRVLISDRENLSSSEVLFYQAGGGKYNETQVEGIKVYDGPFVCGTESKKRNLSVYTNS